MIRLFSDFKNNKKSSDRLISILILVIVISIRLLTSSSHNVYHSHDTGNVAFAVQDYNLDKERPHLPGYFLHVMIIRSINMFTNDTHTSMIFLSALYSALGVMLGYLIMRKFSGISQSVIIASILATNPFVWFYGSLTEIYSFDLFFSAFIIYLSFDKKHIYLTPVIFAIGAGVRQTSVIILLPFYIRTFYKFYKEDRNVKRIIVANLIGAIALLMWFIPFLLSVGGLSHYINLYKTQNPVPDIGLLKNSVQMLIYFFWIIFPVIIFVITSRREGKLWERKIIEICLYILIPSFLVFTFVHYTRGYWLIATIPVMMIIAMYKFDLRFKLTAGIVILLQLLYFFFFPYKVDSLDQFYTTSMRKSSDISVILSRLNNQNSVAYSYIRAIDGYQTDIEKVTGELKADNQFNNDVVFIDPTVPIQSNALHAGLSNYHFSSLDLKNKNLNFIYEGLVQNKYSNREAMLSNCLGVSLLQFEKIIKDKVQIIFRTNSLIFWKTRADSSFALNSIYIQYFQKQQEKK